VIVYIAHARATGGQVGTARSDDGQIDLKLHRLIEIVVREMAATRSRCLPRVCRLFIGALRVVVGERHIRVPEEVAVDLAMSLGSLAGAEGFGIAVITTIRLPGGEEAIAEELVIKLRET
jgi:lipoyl-dependent peroxiredoxin